MCSLCTGSCTWSLAWGVGGSALRTRVKLASDVFSIQLERACPAIGTVSIHGCAHKPKAKSHCMRIIIIIVTARFSAWAESPSSRCNRFITQGFYSRGVHTAWLALYTEMGRPLTLSCITGLGQPNFNLYTVYSNHREVFVLQQTKPLRKNNSYYMAAKC